jgi:hypothetical protein
MNEQFLNQLKSEQKKENQINQSRDALLSDVNKLLQKLSEPVKVEPVRLSSEDRSLLAEQAIQIKQFKALSEKICVSNEESYQMNHKVLEKRKEIASEYLMKYVSILTLSTLAILIFSQVIGFGKNSYYDFVEFKKRDQINYNKSHEAGYAQAIIDIKSVAPPKTAKWLENLTGK